MPAPHPHRILVQENRFSAPRRFAPMQLEFSFFITKTECKIISGFRNILVAHDSASRLEFY
jgi:hypothetical protein